MKESTQKQNGLIDAVLFVVFILSFFLDLTGLALHQWLGLAAGALALYHLARHWRWVIAVGLRLSERLKARAGWYFLIDFGLLFGFASIVISGILISSWLDLAWIDASVVWAYHVTTALLTLGLLLVKIALHARWILHTAHAQVLAAPRPSGKGIAAGEEYARGRREFLKLMGAVGVVSLLALAKGASSLGQAQETQATASTGAVEGTATTAVPTVMDVPAAAPGSTANATAQSTAVPTPTAAPTATAQANSAGSSASQACTVRCNRGCSFPGHCGRYVDTNNNGKCDRGECL